MKTLATARDLLFDHTLVRPIRGGLTALPAGRVPKTGAFRLPPSCTVAGMPFKAVSSASPVPEGALQAVRRAAPYARGDPRAVAAAGGRSLTATPASLTRTDPGCRGGAAHRHRQDRRRDC